jgi:hypothetical protein
MSTTEEQIYSVSFDGERFNSWDYFDHPDRNTMARDHECFTPGPILRAWFADQGIRHPKIALMFAPDRADPVGGLGPSQWVVRFDNERDATLFKLAFA